MKTIVLAAITAFLQAGCLTTPAEPVVSIPAPVCHNAKQCEVMWTAAQDWLPRVGRMQVVQVLPDSIVTSPRLEGVRTTMHGVVVKRPLTDGSYELSARFECGEPQFPCTKLEQSGVNLFNTMVSAAGEGCDQ
ncbi:hypothetical protein [Caballeronia humi]|uniref:Lipoprotein n=1 Tax=Caballeronia humi TaxID=326474 RepID=A0A158JGH1_9BURK|nr:hypothetical protein [Caballeronia humi]SAL67569.1 hypothetical protein AWB65_06543 [Caballeronia humi]